MPPAVVQAEAEILSADEARRAALVAGDVGSLRGLLSTGLVYVHSNGLREDFSVYMDRVLSGTYRYVAMTAAEQTVTLFGDGGLLTGRTIITPRSADGGTSMTLDCRSAMLWRRGPGGWRLEYYQGTLISKS